MDSIEDSAEGMKKMFFEEELEGCPFLVMANKQDENNVFSPDIIKDKMGEIKGRKFYVIGTSTINGEGIKEGFDWIVDTLIEKNNNKKK